MAFDSEGLLDAGTGAFQGGSTAAKISGGNPWATGAGILAGGALSFFGGASSRKTEKKANKKTMALMDQELELGDFSLGEARRARAMDIERRQRSQKFGELLGKYFESKRVP